ncbi:MAG: hypothetical protein KME20_23290 [Kaiparowitsia implicata GSE-PSE-MK54-09C]|jgi:hypothetical protein|nr:hypothetical protein [Kaiparowitsia implicata GSE-PSE-MK54-09C]
MDLLERQEEVQIEGANFNGLGIDAPEYRAGAGLALNQDSGSNYAATISSGKLNGVAKVCGGTGSIRKPDKAPEDHRVIRVAPKAPEK